MSTPARYLLLAQIGFFLSLAVCVLLDSAGLHSNHGWSYYEGRSQTFVPYLLGLGWCVLLIALAAGLLSRSAAPAGFPAALKLLSVLLLLDVATPDTVDAAFSWAHDLTSALLFLYELGLAVWLVRAVWPTRVARLLGGGAGSLDRAAARGHGPAPTARGGPMTNRALLAYRGSDQLLTKARQRHPLH